MYYHHAYIILDPVTVKLVTRVPDVTQYIIGTDVQLTCHADGNPTPEFYWQYKPLGGDDATNITNSNSKTLFLNDLQLGDSGVYSCIAENTLGGVAYNGTYPTNIDVGKFGNLVNCKFLVCRCLYEVIYCIGTI